MRYLDLPGPLVSQIILTVSLLHVMVSGVLEAYPPLIWGTIPAALACNFIARHVIGVCQEEQNA